MVKSSPWGGRVRKGRMKRRLREIVFVTVLLLAALVARLYEIQILTPPGNMAELRTPAQVLKQIPVEEFRSWFSGQ